MSDSTTIKTHAAFIWSVADPLRGDGNPIPLRRHRPTNPRRTRQPRFVEL